MSLVLPYKDEFIYKESGIQSMSKLERMKAVGKF